VKKNRKYKETYLDKVVFYKFDIQHPFQRIEKEQDLARLSKNIQRKDDDQRATNKGRDGERYCGKRSERITKE
jgi:hypothetical protein